MRDVKPNKTCRGLHVAIIFYVCSMEMCVCVHAGVCARTASSGIIKSLRAGDCIDKEIYEMPPIVGSEPVTSG